MGKVTIPCDISLEALRSRWDYMTGEAFYAGCDEVMDLVFMGKRDDNDKVSLVHRARAMRGTFSTVFYGELRATETGSEIVGVFAKRRLDYVIALVIAGLALGFAQGIVTDHRYLSLGISFAAVAIVLLALRVSKRSKQTYLEFLDRIKKGI